eukprot:CAMPEP_0181139872 /NCGR_PEP_ID=MMETSP1071-20121207/35010_1 /TAXON_ID=35127 /ORGANISM="Thalassiosira sp., Strain NH16" /LENGTH=244 /DNA_ID=CAMNT_0023226801 /DNA_START=10 /DNA_END=744 /DNA_ORIENTATION=-
MPFWSRRSETESNTSASDEKDISSSDELAPSSSFAAPRLEASTCGVVGDDDGGALVSSRPPSVTTAAAPSPPESSSPYENAVVSGTWTRFLPEAFGIRKEVEESPFRWCARESAMWGVATGTMMGLHRLRMRSHYFFAFNVACGTCLLVAAPSYYFCFRRREHQENIIAMMMAANEFLPGEEMPEAVPMDGDHPFLDVREKGGGEGVDDRDLKKEFVARLKERKDWQEPHQTQDADDVFKEVKK